MGLRDGWVRAFFALLVTGVASVGGAQPLVPGTGQRVAEVGDDFEDAEWAYHLNSPKSSENIDKRNRNPGGFSKNGRWFEAALRGQPDVIKRVDTPEGGLEGSAGSLMIQTLQSGVPGMRTLENQQDDLIANVRSRMGGMIPVSWQPSVVVRLYMPPVEEWENRSGSQFGFRAGVHGSKGGFGSSPEEYWPGLFVQFYSETDQRSRKDSARWIIRSNQRGQDLTGPEIKQTGWWTLGMSFTADGQVHYYAHPGVEDLTAADHLASHFPYGFRCQTFDTFFFDVFNRDDGQSWSTAWIVDDAMLYLVSRPQRPSRVASPPRATRKK